ncbi:MAG: hypothetical protein IKU01_01760 [Bacteroidales bacterium]|nr:hypothetical protein [Bacteroidales bacterium]
MASSQKKLNDTLRENFLQRIIELLEFDEEILRTGANEIAIPCVDSEQNEKFVQIVVKVPTGSRDGEPYDGYSMAEDYKLKLEEKERKRKENEEKKRKKVERDKKIREKKEEMRAKREA